MLPSDRWEVVEKFLKGVPALKVIDKRLKGDSRANENRSSPQDVGIRVNDG